MTKPFRFCRRCWREEVDCECLSLVQVFGCVLGVLAMIAAMLLWGTMITGMLGGL